MSTTHATALAVLTGGALAAAISIGASAASPRFFEDDPIWHERDTENASGMKPLEVDLFVDATTNILNQSAGRIVRAQDVNTVDEVPDSAWFTNRGRLRPLTPDDILNGPDTGTGPEVGEWTVTSSKSDGVTPGFTIRDARRQVWFLKFDPPGFRGMSTGTEVAVTKLMWALGYNVAENHIAYMRREQLVIGENARFTPPGGKRRAMRAGDLDTLLARADRERDGSYRVVASKAVPGTPIGRIRFFGTRPDDPNDVVPHENRRELRGYGVFAAWLNHVDGKAINSLDTLITEGNRSYVRHYLLDFGSALGSAGIAPADYWAGSEYLLEPGSLLKQLVGFGFVRPAWRTTSFYEAPAMGRLPADNRRFNPETWRPRLPNQAFLHARADDKFWAASKLMALSNAHLRAAVRAGDFGDPRSEAFLVRALAERRDAIGRAYLTDVNPIADPALDRGGVLTFRNLAVDAEFAPPPGAYRAEWFRFDNTTGDATRLGDTVGSDPRLMAPAALPHEEDAFVQVKVSSIDAFTASWEKPVTAYFQRRDGQWRLVGFERLPS